MSKLRPDWAWPVSCAPEAVTALAHARRLNPKTASPMETRGMNTTIETLAMAVGLEAESIETRYNEIETLLAQADGAILKIKSDHETALILVIKSGKKRLLLLTPDLQRQYVSARIIRDLLCAPLEEKLAPIFDNLLAGLPTPRRSRARRGLMDIHLGGESIAAGWLLRSSPSAHFFSQLRRLGLCNRALQLIGAHALAYGLWICAWWLIGAAALEGRYDVGWWQAWVLLLVSLVGLQTLSSLWQTQFLTGAAVLLKRRLLYGALRLDQDQVRRQGAGQLLGQVLEAEALENLSLNGGIAAILALFEIAASLFVLAFGAGGGSHALLLLAWLGFAAFFTWRYRDYRRAWTSARLGLTHHLTEQMLGHRTRLVQQPMAQWHNGEDTALTHYNEVSKKMDQWAIALTTLIPRGWLIVSLIALSPALFATGASVALAVGLGGCLLAYAALQKSTQGLLQLTAATIAWNQVAPIFHAGRSTSLPVTRPNTATRSNTVLIAQDLVFRHRNQGKALLRGINLQIGQGERILLQGASGGGKSTLANIFTGLRVADSGLLLLNGLDRQTLGTSWRRQAVIVPQFHENYILSESLAFNLLMGRNWPPTPADLDEAKTLCRTLGLGELIERMPNGLWQMIGENGWRLSHGERSRVYLARALLQPATLMVFDESFSALDPESLSHAIECVILHAPSLIVIAHP